MTRPLTLADFAAVERDGREAFYPEMVRNREITAEAAEHDWRCWLAIAAWCEAPTAVHRFHEWGLTWRDLAEAAQLAVRRREAALAEAKAEHKAPLEARLDAVAAIAWRLANVAEHYRKLNVALQAQAAARSQERAAA